MGSRQGNIPFRDKNAVAGLESGNAGKRNNNSESKMSRHCKQCKKILTIKTYPCGVREGPVQFSNRKFCDAVCMGAYNRMKAEWTRVRKKKEKRERESHVLPNGEVVYRSTLQRYARRYRLDTCEECGSKQNLHIHHIDHQWWNNDPHNLMTLCRTCHYDHHKSNEGPDEPVFRSYFMSFLVSE